MNTAALRAALTSPLFVCSAAFTLVSTAFVVSAHVDTLSTITWAAMFGGALLAATTVEYRIARDRMAIEAERAQWLAERAARLEAHRAAADEARVEHEKDRAILRIDHERRLVAIRATGTDPGPSAEAAAIQARVA